ncbi:MAG TPA: hypothetical protein VK992_07245 [Candidatus Caenarcaniphilales bacterium]|nr:hypothetical protein [Candidatus Caenarcaniphilales bacterium]
MTYVPGTRGWRATPERPSPTILLAGTWRAREGEEDAIREIVETIVPLARADPGCRAFSAHR